MSVLHFYIDHITERDFSTDAVELVSAPFEHSWMYCLNYAPNLLGPITQRKIVAAASLNDSKSFWKKLPLLVGSLRLPKEDNSVAMFSQGMMICSRKTKSYYFFSPYWEDASYSEFYHKQSWPIRVWLKFHQRRVLQSLKKMTHKVICSSKHLAEKYQISNAQIIYPFYQTEDFPKVDLVVDKKSFTIYLEGATLQQKEQLSTWINSFTSDWSFFLFGAESDAKLFTTSNNLRFESHFCSATFHAAFLQSALFFQFNHAADLSFALGALASGTLIAHLESAVLNEVVPEGLRVNCQNLNQFISMASEMSLRGTQLLIDLGEARRFSLRFSEKNFKDKYLKSLNN